MGSKSKRRHANKQSNRARNKPSGSIVEVDSEGYAVTDTEMTPEEFSVAATAQPAASPAIMTPADFKKREKERLKEAKLEAKAAKQKEKEEKKKDKTKKEPTEKKKPFAFIGEIGSELKKVHWPTFNQIVKSTSVVLGVVIVFALAVLGIDRLLGFLYELLIKMQGEGA